MKVAPGDGEHPRPPRRFRRLRAWLSRRLLGVDLRSELQAIHIAISEAVMDLGEDLRDGLEAHNRANAVAIMKRADVLAERLDRKTEGMAAELARRIGSLERTGRPMTDRAYAELENEIRGPEADVRLQLHANVQHLRTAPVVDLGSGRGELLEELRDAGIASYGVDSNKWMVAAARAKGLRVLHEDLFDHLERLQDASLGGIAATHVVEHLTPPAVRHLLLEARRVLVPGGSLVLETPNPTSLTAFTQSWGRDPTHRWAPHPDTLAFMTERAGFRLVALAFVSPVPDQDRLKAADADTERLNELLYGPRAFVLVARRPAADRAEGPFDPAAFDVPPPAASGA